MNQEPNRLTRREIIIVCIGLGLVVAAWTAASIAHPVVDSTDLNMSATIVSKDMNPALYPRDNLLANEALYSFYTPFYRLLLRWMWQLGGSFEAGLVILVPLVLVLYLAGMFMLLWRVTGHSWLALALTVASAHYHDTMGAGVWGVGGLAEMMPRTLFMVAIPPLAWLFLRLLAKPTWWQGAILGLGIGVVANLHPVSGLHLLVIFLAGLVVVHINRLQGWLTALAAGVAAPLGAWPVTWNYVANTGQAPGPGLDFETFSRIVSERYSLLFFPSTYRWPLLGLELARPLLDGLVWLYLGLALVGLAWYVGARSRWPGLVRRGWLVGGLVTVAYAYMMVLFDSTFLFLVVAGYVIYLFRRGQYPALDGWLLTLAGLVVLYAFVGYYWLTLLWQNFELWGATALLIEYARAGRFVYLPIYLLAGRAGVALGRELARRERVRAFFGGPGPIFAAVALAWGLLPGVVDYFSASLPPALLGLVVGGLLAAGAAAGFGRLPDPWRAYLPPALLALALFGPPAAWLEGVAPVPTRNLLRPANWQAGSPSRPVDAELYRWVQQNTPQEALFYGCFGSVTMTHFRRKAERSISHNWKDLAYNVHTRATLLPAYDRFRELEAACRSFQGVVEAAHTLQADYILISRQDAATYLPEACFVNERYAVFALEPGGCPAP